MTSTAPTTTDDRPENPAINALAERFPDLDMTPIPLLARADKSQEQLYIRVEPDRLLEVMQFLKEDERCRFEQLVDVNGIDYLNFPKARDRFAVTYGLLSLSRNDRLWVKVFVNDPEPTVPSVYALWNGADWQEREIWDMFGVRFDGHPDLRRILTWEGFKAHPLRKDYPLTGKGEREDYRIVERDSA